MSRITHQEKRCLQYEAGRSGLFRQLLCLLWSTFEFRNAKVWCIRGCITRVRMAVVGRLWRHRKASIVYPVIHVARISWQCTDVVLGNGSINALRKKKNKWAAAGPSFLSRGAQCFIPGPRAVEELKLASTPARQRYTQVSAVGGLVEVYKGPRPPQLTTLYLRRVCKSWGRREDIYASS